MNERPRKPGHWQRASGTALLGALFLAIPVLGVRLAMINTSQREELLKLAREQQAGKAVIPARRGRILDRRHRVMATSRNRPDVFIDPQVVADLDDAVGALAARLNTPPESIREMIDARPDSRYVVLARSVDDITADAVRELNVHGVGLTDQPRRYYPHEQSLAHVLGFVGHDGHGLEGIELRFDEHLGGEDGRLSSIRDARRRALFAESNAHRPPVDGGDVVLTIDAHIQRIAEEALDAQVREFKAESGVAIVVVPDTGEVLAMATVPTFDANHAQTTPPDVRRNRAVTDPVEPGSTFKPFVAAGALDAGVVNTTETFDGHDGVYQLGGRTIRDTHPHDDLDLLDTITYSSNVAMSQIAQRMGDQLVHDTLRAFGFGEQTGIELPGESWGLVYDWKNWHGTAAASMSFGYEVLVTPIQLITGFCALINDGERIRPHIVSELRAADGRVIERLDKVERPGRAIGAETARFISRTAMRSVVENGGSGRYMPEGYRVFGKTGTTKLVGDNGTYERRAYMSTFMGAAPLEDPRIAVVVMIRRPDASKGYYGAVVAAPAVGTIIKNTLEYLEVPPDGPDAPVALAP